MIEKDSSDHWSLGKEEPSIEQ
jgi:hypothetical protein